MRQSWRVVTEPTWEPVTLEQARLWCRVASSDTTQDWALLRLVTAARRRAEQITGSSIAQKTIEVRMDGFPSGTIELPCPPLISVTYVTYATADGDATLDAGSPEAFLVDTASWPGRLSPLYGQTWPATRTQIGSVRIGVSCGYATANAVPAEFKLWLQQRVSTWFDNREHLAMGNIDALPRDFVDGLLDAHRTDFFA